MHTIFRSDFSVGEMANWHIEQHVPDGYTDFSVKDEKMIFYDAGNRILPNVPALENFIIDGVFDVDWNINNRNYSLQIYFAYNEHTRQGLMLDFTSDGKETKIRLFNNKRLLTKTKTDAFKAENVNFKFKCENKKIALSLNGKKYFSYTVSESVKGAIALGRGAFLGELRMSEFAVSSSDEFGSKNIWNNLKIPFTAINGMDIPIVWTVNSKLVGSNITQVDIELSGGEKSRPDIPWFRYHGHYVELLTSPYLRIESGSEFHELKLSDQTLRLANPRKHWFYFFNNKPQWPLKRTFFLRNVSKNSLLFAGYQAYSNCAVNKHLEVKKPYETAYNVKSEKIIYAGTALAQDSLTIELQSPPDKQICKTIPETVHEYDKALEFAEKNHYFSDCEDCRFKFELFSRIDPKKISLRLRYRLENAFFEPLEQWEELMMDPESEIIASDIRKLHSNELSFGIMDTGVYHLRFELYLNNELYLQDYRAFEVNGKDQSAIEASRLPVLFSMSTETRGQDTDYFDPCKGGCADVSHYISTMISVMPHFAREKKPWELLKIYKRKWFLWLTSRTAEDWSLKKNCDLIEHCDYLLTPPEGQREVSLFARLCFRGAYANKTVMKILYKFALENNFHVPEIKRCMEQHTMPDLNIFNELVEKHFYQWLDFFKQRFMAIQREKQKCVEKISKSLRHCDYGPMAVYASSYKTAHAAGMVSGLDIHDKLEKVYDGFLIFEDYPYACRYSINRGVFFLADIKRNCPELKVYPEFYNRNGSGVPCPDAAVARVWPSYGIWNGGFLDVNCSIKRILEYVCACVWHDGKDFAYWRDHGFQTRVWERERYEALLKVWSFINKHQPQRPLKANCFISSEKCCVKSPVYYDEYPGDNHETLGDMFNPAEECIAYSYEMSRNASQNAGFVADFKSLAVLTTDDIDVLVLPPLTAAAEEELKNIRRLHEQGVSLLAFGEVGGLEDLFGVAEGKLKQVNNIKVNEDLEDNLLSELAAISEYTEHRACKGKYQADGADVLLNGEIPVLFTNRTKWGKTALFNIPPTAVRRQDQFNRVSFGRDSISELINESTKLILRYLSRPTVESDAGKIAAFKDAAGAVHIIVEEDAHPMEPKAIMPCVSVNLPGLADAKISCTKDFAILSRSGNSAKIALDLKGDEFAIISIEHHDQDQ